MNGGHAQSQLRCARTGGANKPAKPMSGQRDGMLPGHKARERARYARKKVASTDYSSIHKHIELAILMAPVSRRISRFLCRAYAARWLVLRLRLRWIIHPGVFSSRVKQKNFMGAFYSGTCISVNLYGTAALPTIRCLPFSTP